MSEIVTKPVEPEEGTAEEPEVVEDADQDDEDGTEEAENAPK